MALNKRDMVRALARQTDLTQAQVRELLDALLELWFRHLAAGDTIAVDNFMILTVQRIQRPAGHSGMLRDGQGQLVEASTVQYRLVARPSRLLREAIRAGQDTRLSN